MNSYLLLRTFSNRTRENKVKKHIARVHSKNSNDHTKKRKCRKKFETEALGTHLSSDSKWNISKALVDHKFSYYNRQTIQLLLSRSLT